MYLFMYTFYVILHEFEIRLIYYLKCSYMCKVNLLFVNLLLPIRNVFFRISNFEGLLFSKICNINVVNDFHGCLQNAKRKKKQE